jgi:hypothetical protein
LSFRAFSFFSFLRLPERTARVTWLRCSTHISHTHTVLLLMGAVPARHSSSTKGKDSFHDPGTLTLARTRSGEKKHPISPKEAPRGVELLLALPKLRAPQRL